MDGINFLYVQGVSHQVLSEPLTEEEDKKFISAGGAIFKIKGEVLGRKAISMTTDWYLKGSKEDKHRVTSLYY